MDSDDKTRYDKAIAEFQIAENLITKQMPLQVSLTKELIENYNLTITFLDSNQKLIMVKTRIFQT